MIDLPRIAVIDLPAYALSVRQPWAWAILNGKDIENRTWRRPNPGLEYRGDFALHAASGMTRDEYEDGRDTIEANGLICPPPADLLRGGIIGAVRVVDVVRSSDSDWFFGPVGLVLAMPRSVEFVPCSGQLGFFAWERSDGSNVPAPAKWMLPKPAAAVQEQLL